MSYFNAHLAVVNILLMLLALPALVFFVVIAI